MISRILISLAFFFLSSEAFVPQVKNMTFIQSVDQMNAPGTSTLDNFVNFYVGSSSFIGGFIPTIYVIIISELGDKTFFIAAIMSIQKSRCLVYAGAMLALTLMTILSAFLGYAMNIVPRKLTWFLSGSLFALFGLKMLKDGYLMKPENIEEEYMEVQEDLRKRDNLLHDEDDKKSIVEDLSLPVTTSVKAAAASRNYPQSFRSFAYSLFNKVLVEAFLLTFLAEWGDRSQISTIVLAATKDIFGVIAGAVLGHAMCTGLAVIAGRILSLKIPIRWLTFLGGITFLFFAAHTFYIGPDGLS